MSVTVGLEEGLGAPRVEVHLENFDDSNAVELNDGDAHELSVALVRAGDLARRYRLEQEAGR